MKISCLNNNQINFKGVPIAKIKQAPKNSGEPAEDLTLYKINETDLLFLYKLKKAIDLKKLNPEESDEGYYNWKYVIDEGLDALKYTPDVVLAAKGNRPCGIISSRVITYKPTGDEIYIRTLASWPYKIGEKAQNTGKALMRGVFEKAQKLSIPVVSCDPILEIINGKSSYSFYKELGMKEQKTEMRYSIDMDYSKALEKIDSKIDYKKIENAENQNLEEILDINYYTDTFESKFSK